MNVKQVATRFIDQLQKPDSDAFARLFTQDGLYADPAFGLARRGHDLFDCITRNGTQQYCLGEWPLCADCVEKLENRGASNISQMLRVGEFSQCKAL